MKNPTSNTSQKIVEEYVESLKENFKITIEMINKALKNMSKLVNYLSKFITNQYR